MSPIIPTEKTFARVFFKKSKKIFCEIFSFSVHFSLDKRNFSFSVHFSLDKRNFSFSMHFSLDKRNFSFSVHFSLDKRNFSFSVHFSLDTIAKLCPSKFGVFPPFRDSIHYYRLLDLPLQMLQDRYTFQSLPKYYCLWVIRHYHTFY